ncbi:MAG: hypothetical protein UX26_C0001G0003 [Parcubacteria group bacterium GW2011_GWC1_45_9]|nr:MAG: hypothetical protein UW85_C0008G0021 [Parcubacteria group bacterium GW2011_GWA1_Parcubacteria_45_10]KKT87958.1 MAG: hypothetical protein UW89_C0014G0009 [Parcubacteria group bacterium GW2011_GWB1_45_10]KKU17433.1 MAG: hypothetical protein UX26_C0001G0003 [Parcubacteria group bacterium GW2011_GWC1_45_9]
MKIKLNQKFFAKAFWIVLALAYLIVFLKLLLFKN